MLTNWSGFYYDGRTANRAVVAVVVTASGLSISRNDGERILWPFTEIRRVAPLGKEATRLERGDEPREALAVNEPGLPEAIAQILPQMETRLGRWAPLHDRDTRRTVIRVMAGALALVAFWFAGLPALAGAVADRLPLRWEESLGASVVDRMVPAAEQCTDSLAVDAVTAIVDRLVAAAPPSRYTFRTRIANDSTVNAFAAPGGYVVVNRGLLEATSTPDELAGVLAHELEHVMLHHSTRALVREIPLRFALTAIGGADAMAGIASRAAGTLSVLRYRRGDEAEADEKGMELIQSAKIDPQGMVDFFGVLGARDSSGFRLVPYLSTHPRTADRITEMRQLRGAATYQPVPFASAPDWATLKTRCDVAPVRHLNSPTGGG